MTCRFGGNENVSVKMAYFYGNYCQIKDKVLKLGSTGNVTGEKCSNRIKRGMENGKKN